jgi:hypothetical protein
MAFESVFDLTGSVKASAVAAIYLIFGNLQLVLSQPKLMHILF